ncbi:MAG TPA: hypothetical protein VKO83_06560 [Steroidobacteraceae bacterium]|nr:hypothetical protein [Steroidobacteraceae bacterium]
MVIQDTRDDLRDLLRCLAMPFQPQSLIFVALTSVLLGFFIGGDLVRMLVSIAAIWLLLVWLTQYALHIIDDAANGVREAQTASVEMATAFLDARAWVHPTLAVAVGVMLYFNPSWPRVPVLLGAALLFPASLGASVTTGHAINAVHPGEIARAMRGLGVFYPLVVVFVLGCALAGVLVAQRADSRILIVAVIEMLLLLVYAGLGGALYLRRRELGFEPRNSPERLAQRAEQERHAERQRFVDELYKDLRVREAARAAGNAARWLRASRPEHLKGDLHAILEAGSRWSEPREYPRLLRGLIPVMLEMKQPQLAFSLVEAGLAAAPDFAPATEAEAVQLIRYAQHTGRRRTARQVLGNYLAAKSTPPPGEALQALRSALENEPG